LRLEPFRRDAARANCYELIGCSKKDRYKISDLMQLGCQSLWRSALDLQGERLLLPHAEGD
jgi:hypothetical protein